MTTPNSFPDQRVGYLTPSSSSGSVTTVCASPSSEHEFPSKNQIPDVPLTLYFRTKRMLILYCFYFTLLHLPILLLQYLFKPTVPDFHIGWDGYQQIGPAF